MNNINILLIDAHRRKIKNILSLRQSQKIQDRLLPEKPLTR